MEMITAKGYIDFNPENVTRKHLSQNWKKTAMIKTYCELDLYYAWFINKRYNLILNRTLRGSHISFINDIVDFDTFTQGQEYFHKKEITFQYGTTPMSNGKHWWLPIVCEDAEVIREALGLKRTPYHGLHLTIGYANERNIEHSKYIGRINKNL